MSDILDVWLPPWNAGVVFLTPTGTGHNTSKSKEIVDGQNTAS